MLAWGICIGTESKYETFARPGLRAHAADAPILERRNQTSIFAAYNSMIDEALDLGDSLEGLVLIHEDVELRAGVPEILMRELAQPDVAIVGAIGGKGLRGVQWSKAEETFGRAPDLAWGDNDHGRGFHDVDSVDGLLLALSPWALRELRFDESAFSGFHAYDADICLQARAAGKRVRVADLDLFHHSKGGFGPKGVHRAMDKQFRKKWGIPLEPLHRRVKSRLTGQTY